MDYKKVYDQIIQRAQKDSRAKSKNQYYENHHITPRCMEGGDDNLNLALLTAREHYLAHWLLCRMHPQHIGLAYAFWRLSNHLVKPTARSYEEAKERFVAVHRTRVISLETRAKISKSKKGCVGFASNEHIVKLIKSGEATRYKKGQEGPRKGAILSKETITKRTLSRSGYKTTEETKHKISEATKGKKKGPWSDERRQNASEAKRGKPKTDVYVCNICEKTIGGALNFRRHKVKCGHINSEFLVS